jgi:mono/diheme cytochrome c family protein
MISSAIRVVAFVALSIPALSVAAQAQRAAGSGPELSDVQKTGKRIFQQRCSVCHAKVLGAPKQYGPALYGDMIEDNEGRIKQFIVEGSPGKMPGFKYGLDPSEIDAIIAYLKTVERPQKNPYMLTRRIYSYWKLFGRR